MAIINTKESRAVATELVATLKSHSEVKLTGLGTFRRVRRVARQGRNPKTGETIQIPARNRLSFRASLQVVRELQ